MGHRRTDRSYAQILIETKSSDVLDQILARFRKHGALSLDEGEGSVRLESAPQDGVFPEGFYATTNLATLIRLEEKWLEVQLPEKPSINNN